jgi:hypothetical protein
VFSETYVQMKGIGNEPIYTVSAMRGNKFVNKNPNPHDGKSTSDPITSQIATTTQNTADKMEAFQQRNRLLDDDSVDESQQSHRAD